MKTGAGSKLKLEKCRLVKDKVNLKLLLQINRLNLNERPNSNIISLSRLNMLNMKSPKRDLIHN